jgi:hypothetical protein
MDTYIDEVALGLIVKLTTLKEVLETLEIDGRHWWIVSDLEEIAATGLIVIAHGYQDCYDPLNTLYFQTPILNPEALKTRSDKVVVLLEFSQWLSDEPGYYCERGRIVQDSHEDLLDSFYPILKALVARLLAKEDR